MGAPAEGVENPFSLEGPWLSARRFALLPLVALLFLPGGQAAAAPGPILAAFADVLYQVRVEDLVENTTLASSDLMCGTSRFDVEEDDQEFDFEDRHLQNACGEIGYQFRVPKAVNRLHVGFEANRSIQQRAPTPVNVVQELWVRNAQGDVLAKTSIVDPASGDSDWRQYWIEIHNLTEPVLNVTWFFWDRGYDAGLSLPRPASDDQAHVSVRSLRLRASNVPLVLDELGVTQHVAGDRTVHERLVQVRMPSQVPRNAMEADYELLLATGANLTAVRGPQGRLLDLDRLQVQLLDGGREVQLNEELVALQGIGAYLFTFRSESPLPIVPAAVVPPPPAPTTIYPLIVGLLALPALPAAFATRYSWGIQRQAGERHRPFVRQVLGIDLGFLIVYVGLCAFVISGSRLPLMAELPLSAEGWLLNAEFLLLTAIFVFLWIAPTRHLVELMRKDLAMSEEVQRNLKRSNEELEQFAYVASHDLQEPLRTISGFSHILKSRYGHVLDDAARHYLELNVQSSFRMQRLINDLLAYSRVETRPLKLEPVDLNELAREVVRDLQELRTQVNGRIRLHPLPTILADRGQVRQLLLNLVQNALKYRHPTRTPEVVVGAEQSERDTVLFVRDNGKGIEPQYHEKIFRMFQRLEGRQSGVDGTGLGLAIVKRVAERHRGSVGLESRPGQGTIFRVTLPKEPRAS